MDIINVIFHDFYYLPHRSFVGDFDIALLKLAKEVDITLHTPVCLPTLGQDYITPDNQGNWRWATALGKEGNFLHSIRYLKQGSNKLGLN